MTPVKLTLSDPRGGPFCPLLNKSTVNFLWMDISTSIPYGFSSLRYLHCLLKSNIMFISKNFQNISIFKDFYYKSRLKKKKVLQNTISITIWTQISCLRRGHSPSVLSNLYYRIGIPLKLYSKGAGKKDPPFGLKRSNHTLDPIGLKQK